MLARISATTSALQAAVVEADAHRAGCHVATADDQP
jgi:hypothetical protein